MGAGCLNPSSVSDNDFEPVRGRATSPGTEQALEDGAYARRLMTARSTDGLTYVQTGLWISDQADAPDAVVGADGTIYLYYTGWNVGDRLNTSAVAISKDQGETWTYRYVELTGSDVIGRAVDPDVVLLEDGTFRLFFTAGNPQGIHYAEGTDGMNFVYKGSIFAQTDDIAINSTTHKIGDTWHMYAVSDDGTERLWHLTSTDGVTFAVYDLTSFPYNNVATMPSNGLWIEDRFHLFLFQHDGVIHSMWSKNGFDWYPDQGERLSPIGEETYVKDSALVPLPNGEFLMVYVTNTP